MAGDSCSYSPSRCWLDSHYQPLPLCICYSKLLQPHKYMPMAKVCTAIGGSGLNLNPCHWSAQLHSLSVNPTVVRPQDTSSNFHHWPPLSNLCLQLAPIVTHVQIDSQSHCSCLCACSWPQPLLWALAFTTAHLSATGHCSQPPQLAPQPTVCTPLAMATIIVWHGP